MSQIDREVELLTTAGRAVGEMKTEAERSRCLAFLVDKYIGPAWAAQLWSRAHFAERVKCADHALAGCKTCWPNATPKTEGAE